jgi:hypothetical protein
MVFTSVWVRTMRMIRFSSFHIELLESIWLFRNYKKVLWKPTSVLRFFRNQTILKVANSHKSMDSW